MKKIFIKVPDEKSKNFRVRREGWRWKGFLTAAGLINYLERRLDSTKWVQTKEKTAIVVKTYDGSSWEIENETMASANPHYLIWATACFLEEYLTKRFLGKVEKKHQEKGNI